MISRQTLVRSALVAVAAASLSACGSMDGMTSKSSVSVMQLGSSMSGAAEVPPNDKRGAGTAEVQFNRDTNVMTYSITYSGLSGPVTGAHIHGPAVAGANAGIVVPFTSVAQSPIKGQATLTPTQAGDLMAGMYYVNLHTAAHPGGEIRGQLQKR
ncbi:MAG TPA: CHRD domain-containing protein [Ramlibacter sp.]|nr:CHRD domain-containing protein [Ramlibacter sp.]